MNDYKEVLEFYKNKNVFVTGHTGFKGSWLCKILLLAGAKVTGYATNPPTNPSLFDIAGIEAEENMTSIIGDIRDFELLKAAYDKAKPDIVLHLAAQPLVIDSYKKPAYTYETNVMGTVNILECVRLSVKKPESFLNVTTDKVYYNDEKGIGFTEDMMLDGYDPYSNSKSCSELVTHSYRSSFLMGEGIPVSTARAGNVIGGGDFAENRIVPDCVRAAIYNNDIVIRNPYSVRPFQHVLEPLFAYLLIAMKQATDLSVAGAYNVGPEIEDCVETGVLADIFCECWGENIKWDKAGVDPNAYHEAGFLRLDCSKLKRVMGWETRWNIKEAIKMTCEWSKAWMNKQDIKSVMDEQIMQFVKGA